MKRTRKYSLLSIILALMIIVTGIPGCGDTSNHTGNTESQYESETGDTLGGDSETEEDSESESADDSQVDDNTQTEDNTGNDTQVEDNTEDDTQGDDPEENTESGSNNTEIGNDKENNTSEEDIPTSDPYVGMTKEEFYANYKPATNLADALYRSKHGFLSGSLDVPGQYAQDAEYRPMEDGLYVRNTDSFYADDGNTYVVVDAYGNEVMRIFKGGAYITLEEVAAYMYAFGGTKESIPANYTSSKKTKPANSMWGEYLRVNHSYFTGNTNKFPYEPELPNISGCGGDLQYWELDIGTTGTVTPGYSPAVYNNGSKITRGAARIVYARQDLNRNGTYEQDEIYVFYTHNHYNDFREYLNYYGGWGEMFGNVTGGGEYSSKTNYNPTPYVPTAYKSFSREISKANRKPIAIAVGFLFMP